MPLVNGETLVRDLQVKKGATSADYLVGESRSGTRLFSMDDVAGYVTARYTFSTVSDMLKSKLNEGDVVQTLGYHEPNDGGASSYIIEYSPSSIPDNGMLHVVQTNTALRARLIAGETVSVTQFGAYGDGTHDDCIPIQRAFDSGKIVSFAPNTNYRVNTPVVVKNRLAVNGNFATFYSYNGYAINVSEDVTDVVLKDLNVNCANNGLGIRLKGKNKYITMENISISGVNGKSRAVLIEDPINVLIENLSVNGIVSDDNTGTHGVNVHYSKDFKGMSSVVIRSSAINNCHRGVYLYDESKWYTIKRLEYDGSFINEGRINDSTAVYIDAVEEAVDMNVVLDNLVVSKYDKVLYTGTNAIGFVTVNNIQAHDVKGGFKILANDLLSFTLSGSIVFKGDDVAYESDRFPIFEAIGCNLNTSVASFNYNHRRYVGVAEQTSLIGVLNDTRSPIVGPEYICNYQTSKILCEIPANACYDWVGPLVLSEIRGLEGQVVAVKSSSGQEITSNGNIIVYPNEPTRVVKEPLPKDSYWLFKCHNQIWRRFGIV